MIGTLAKLCRGLGAQDSSRRLPSSLLSDPKSSRGMVLLHLSFFSVTLILISVRNKTESFFVWHSVTAFTAKNAVLSKLSHLQLTSKQLSQDHPTEKTILVIGAGVGGLALASRIASSIKDHSYKVLVLEKNAEGGGRCGSSYVEISNIGTFRHERGPSLLLLPQVYSELFKDCGESTPEQYGLTITPCVPAYRVIFSDGDTVDVGFPAALSSNSTNEALLSRKKLDSIEPNGAERWDSYMDAMGAFLDCGLPNFIQEELELSSLPAFLYQALKDGGKFWPLRAHSECLDAIFHSTKLKALASFQDLYVGLEPYKNEKELFGGVLKKTAPAVFGLLSALELHPTNKYAGVFAPVGGFQSVYNAFKRLAESHGVVIRYNTTVTKIFPNGVYCTESCENYYEGAQSASTATWIPSNLVVVNADLPYALNTLLNWEKTDKEDISKITYDWDQKFDYSSGVIAFHWCISRPLDDLNTHNVFLCAENTTEAKQSWAACRATPKGAETPHCMVQEPFNFYVHRPCKSDPSATPDGYESLTVLVPCQTLNHRAELGKVRKVDSMKAYRTQFDDAYVSNVREAVLTRLSVLKGVGNLKDAILYESIDTPATYADKYNLAAGTPFGLSHGFGQLSITRPSSEVKGIDNVLMVGASSRPGNGVPLVLIGAKLVWKKILKKISYY